MVTKKVMFTLVILAIFALAVTNLFAEDNPKVHEQKKVFVMEREGNDDFVNTIMNSNITDEERGLLFLEHLKNKGVIDEALLNGEGTEKPVVKSFASVKTVDDLDLKDKIEKINSSNLSKELKTEFIALIANEYLSNNKIEINFE